MAEEQHGDSPWQAFLVGGACLVSAFFLWGVFSELDSGTRESVRVWWGFALLYKTLGTGLTVSLLGLIGAFMTVSGLRRLFG